MGQVPPPFYQQQPPPAKKSNAALIIAIVLACILIPCIGLVVLGFWLKSSFWDKGLAPFAGCEMSFETVQRALQDYARDHKGSLPSAATWQSDVKSYYGREVAREGMNNQHIIPTMDPNGPWGCAPIGTSPATGMAFNSDLSGKNIDKVKDPDFTALVFEIPTPQMNAHEPYKESDTPGPLLFGTHRHWIVFAVRGEQMDKNNFKMNGQATTTSGP